MLRPLSIINISDLNFGTMLAGTGGTVEINPVSDARSVNGGILEAGGAPAAAQFLTFGGPLQILQVRRGPLPVLQREGGSETMQVELLTLNGPVNRFINAEGLLDLRVGGRLRVGADQAPGVYSGTFEIFVNYF